MHFTFPSESLFKTWKSQELKQKLSQLAKAKKNTAWITSELSCKKSHWISRFFWKVIAKHVCWIRRLFYHIDLKQSQSILNRLQKPILQSKNSKLKELFFQAAKNFNKIAPRHKICLIEEVVKTNEEEPKDSFQDKLKKLYFFAQDFSNHEEKTPSLAADCLVELAYLPNFETCTDKSLNQKQELFENAHSFYPLPLKAHRKQLKTLLPLFIAKGLCSDKKEIKEKSEALLKDLIQNYFSHVRYSVHHKEFKEILFSLTVSYTWANQSKTVKEQEKGVANLWEAAGLQKRTILFELTGSPWNIKPKTPVLKRAVSLTHIQEKEPLLLSRSWKFFDKYKEKTPIDQLIFEDAVANDLPGIAKYIAERLSVSKLKESLKRVRSERKKDSLKLASWIKNIVKAPHIATPKDLKYCAETLGYGYKAANLMVLEGLLDTLSSKLTSCRVKVPPFLPISDFEVRGELKDFLPTVDKLWGKFLATFDSKLKELFLQKKTAKEAAKVPLKISEEGEKILNCIKSAFKQHFEKHLFYSIQLEIWLEELAPEFVIVRSTGKEDSEENSNAGGNKSLPYIKPNKKAISQAAGKVLASYFSKKSILQRLIAGDQSLFKDPPFLPILVQTMVVENTEGFGSNEQDIPRSGVIFTQQQGKKEGVVLVQAGLGNNEGIVTGQVKVDTYYLDSESLPLKVIREKKTRFVSKQVLFDPDEYKLIAIKNNLSALENSQALPDPLLFDIKKIADTLSCSYALEDQKKKAMDVEYTVKLKEKGEDCPIVYLLQARPLIKTASPKPSYIDFSSFKNGEKIAALSLLDGGSKAKKIDHFSEVIAAQDIDQALNSYLECKTPKNIKLILMRKIAPLTSHQAVILRSKGVPVFVIEDLKCFNTVLEWIKKSKKRPLFFDSQRGVVFKPFSSDNDHIIKEGWISYPIPMGFSFHPDALPEPEKIDEDLIYHKLLECRSFVKSFAEEEIKLPKKFSLEAIEQLSLSSSQEELEKSLKTLPLQLLFSVEHLVKTTKAFSKENKGFSLALQTHTLKVLLFALQVLKLLKEEIKPAVQKFAPHSIERLYAIKKLEAMLLQKPQEHILQSYSFKSLIKESAVLIESLKNYNKIFQNRLSGGQVLKVLHLLQIEKFSFTEKAGKSWTQFIIHLNGLKTCCLKDQVFPKHFFIDQLYNSAKRMEKLGLIPVWLNLIFTSRYDAALNDFKEEVVNELTQLESKEGETLEWVEENFDEISILEEHLQEWEKPPFVKKTIPILREKFETCFGFSLKHSSKSIAKNYQEAGQLGKIAILQFMKKAVDLYDRIIKVQKGSLLYPSQKEKVKDLFSLLEGYFSFLSSTTALISPSDEEQLMAPAEGKALTFNQYLKKLAEGTDYTIGGKKTYHSLGFNNLKSEIFQEEESMCEGHLLGSPLFSVDALIIGSKADMQYSVHWPKTLEDYFTTFHQNLEKIQKYQMTRCGFDSQLLEGRIKDFAKLIESAFDVESSHLEIKDSKVKLTFQVPLRLHSAKLFLSTDIKTPSAIKLEAETFGHNAFERWDQTASLISFFAQTKGISFPKDTLPKIYYDKTEGIKFSLLISPEYDTPKELVSHLYYIIKTLSLKEISHKGKKGFHALFSLMKSFKNAPPFRNLPQDFYKSALWASSPLMKKFYAEKDNNALLKCTSGTLLGLAAYGLSDYKRSGGLTGGGIENQGLEEYFSKTKYFFVKDNTLSNKRSIKLIATLHLIRLLETWREGAESEINALINAALIKKELPEVKEALVKAKELTLPKTKYFSLLLKRGHYMSSFTTALESDLEESLQDLANALNKEGEKKKIRFAKEICSTFYWGKNKKFLKKFLEKLYLPENIKLPYSSKARRNIRENLDKNVTSLKDFASSEFNKKKLEILNLAVDSLIGLSQSVHWEHLSFENFDGLQGILGNPKYANFQPRPLNHSTSLLKTAAPLYIVKVLEEGALPKQKIVHCLEKLFSDYCEYGRFGVHKKGYKTALTRVIGAFFSLNEDKTWARKKILSWVKQLGEKQESAFLKSLQDFS